MPTELDEQLSMYFDWVERECGFGLHRSTRSTTLSPADPAGSAEITINIHAEPPHRPSRLRLVAALAAAAAVVSGLLLVNRGSNTQPATPAGTGAVESSASSVPVATPNSEPNPTSIDQPTSTTGAATASDDPRPIIENLALGESVMQAVQSVLPQYGVNVDAQESIQGKGIIANLRATISTYNITNSVIIQSGTNGPVTKAQYDEMANLAAGLPHAYFLTIKAPLAWVAENNALIRALPETHPNVTVIDWETLSQQLGPDDLSASDGGVHLNSGAAVRFYANMILGALGKPLIPDS